MIIHHLHLSLIINVGLLNVLYLSDKYRNKNRTAKYNCQELMEISFKDNMMATHVYHQCMSFCDTDVIWLSN